MKKEDQEVLKSEGENQMVMKRGGEDQGRRVERAGMDQVVL